VKIKSKGRKEGFNFLKVILLTSRGLGFIGRNKSDNKIEEN
jgi:hypothetical protein